MAYITMGLMARNRRRKEMNSGIATQEKELMAARKPYKASEWCRDMVNTIKNQTNDKGEYKPGSAFLDQLSKKKGQKVPDHAKKDLREKGMKV